MTAYLGNLGALVPFKCPSALVFAGAPRSATRRTLGGVVKEQRGPRGRREWSVDIGTATPAEVAGLRALDLGAFGPPPWVWVDPWAQVTNLLSPDASVMLDGTFTGSAGVVTAGGAGVTADGVRFGKSALVSDGVLLLGYRDGSADRFPVVPGLPVTGSFYASGTGRARLDFHDAADGLLSTVYGANVSGTLTRRHVSAVVPVGAVSGQLRIAGHTQVTLPAVTWSADLLEWSTGAGCNRVTVDGLSEAVQLASSGVGGVRRSSLSFTVRELG